MTASSRTCDIAIIGGGIIGCSIAHHLYKLGARDVLMLEREDMIATGSTGRSAGGVRQQFVTPANIAFSLHSVKVFERFAGEMDSTLIFHQTGYLFCAHDEATLDTLKKLVARQRSHGVPVSIVPPEEIRDLVPGIETADLTGASFCPTDGFLDPYEVAAAYFRSARRAGLQAVFGAEVTGFDRQGDRITGVRTQDGVISCNTVVLAAGAWTGAAGKMAGVDIPVEPVRRQIFVTHPIRGPRGGLPRIPLTIDMKTGVYFRREGGGLLLGWANPDEPAAFNFRVDWDYMTRILEMALPRMPILEQAEMMRGWAGLYDTSPDHCGILGRVPGVDNLYVASGFSGHGIMHSPAVGLSLAELILDQPTTLDIKPFSLERFATGELLNETAVI
ncbi:MAG: Sarcosine oxidase subunit beta [Myxococcota bacterium]|nr:Sarcosine oxidase subunit beta [Myxococcota bacterium]